MFSSCSFCDMVSTPTSSTIYPFTGAGGTEKSAAKTPKNRTHNNPQRIFFIDNYWTVNSTFGAVSEPVVASKRAAFSNPNIRATKTVGTRSTEAFHVVATVL